MIRKTKKWLIAKFLPELASTTLKHEVDVLRRRLTDYEKELQDIKHEKDRLQSYIYGMERCLRSQQLNINIKGGAETNGSK